MPATIASGLDASRARPFAHSRRAVIFSAAVFASGTLSTIPTVTAPVGLNVPYGVVFGTYR